MGRSAPTLLVGRVVDATGRMTGRGAVGIHSEVDPDVRKRTGKPFDACRRDAGLPEVKGPQGRDRLQRGEPRIGDVRAIEVEALQVPEPGEVGDAIVAYSGSLEVQPDEVREAASAYSV